MTLDIISMFVDILHIQNVNRATANTSMAAVKDIHVTIKANVIVDRISMAIVVIDVDKTSITIQYAKVTLAIVFKTRCDYTFSFTFSNAIVIRAACRQHLPVAIRLRPANYAHVDSRFFRCYLILPEVEL